MAEPNPLDPLLMDQLLRKVGGLIIELSANHKYWEVRIHGSDGIARLETICQEDIKHPLRPTVKKPA
jgi:hypothetical protein